MFNLKLTNMNVKSLLMFLALAGLGTACSTDELGGSGDTGTASGSAGDIQLVFSGSGESVDYTKAAIASDSENKIDNLNVYVFASDAEDGTYYYLETWKSAATDDATAKTFGMQAAGSTYKASIRPGELKGVPYLKLYCLANSTDLYAADGTTAFTFTAVTTDPGTGAITNNTGATPATTETKFLETFTKKMTAAESFPTSLVMSGVGKTKISGSVSKVSIDLKRIVARFDIDNTTQNSRLTIETITMVHGRTNAPVWPLSGTTQPVIAAGDLDTKLITYKEIDFKTNVPGANQGIAESAMYVYPNLATDESVIIIKGQYKSLSTGVDVPVQYEVPVVQKQDGQPDGAESPFVAIKSNSRYKLRILDVTNSNIYATFEVEDWTSGGGVNVKPDNDAPVFDPATGFTGANAPTAIAGSTNQFKIADAGTFNLTIAATGKVRAVKALATKAGDIAPWLTCGVNPTYEVKDGVTFTTFAFTIAGATGKQPVAFTFINEAASYDPALQTTLTFFGPLAKPNVSEVADGHTLGNTVTATDPTAPTATMYKVAGSEIKVNVMCIEGINDNTAGMEVKAPAGFSVTKVGETVNYTTTYSIKVTDAGQVSTGEQTVTFYNKEDNTVKTELKITMNASAMSAEAGTNSTDNAADYTDIANGNITIDLDLLASDAFTFKVKAPQGFTAPDFSADSWLTITETTPWSASQDAVYSVSAKNSGTYTTPSVYKFKNKLAGGADLTVTLTKGTPKPWFEATTGSDAFNTINVSNPLAVTANMFLATGSQVKVKANYPKAFTFNSIDGITAEKDGNGIYTIKITDPTKFTDGTPIVLTATNTATSVTATITITPKDPVMKVTLTANSAVVESTSGNDIIYTVDADNLVGGGFIFTVSAPGGATLTGGMDAALTGQWLIKHPSNYTGTDVITTGGSSVYNLKSAADTSVGSDITLTFTNTVTGGGDQKIIFRKK